MKILIDSHVLVWLIGDTSKISQKSLKILQNSRNELYVSQISLIELAIKQKIGKLDFNVDFAKEAELAEIELMDFNPKDIEEYKNLPELSWQDPFDHMLIAHAINNKLTFCTADKHIINAKVEGLRLLKP